MAAQADIHLACSSPQDADAVAQALAPELEGIPGRAFGNAEGSVVRIHLESPDLAGLRTALTSTLRLGDLALRIVSGA
ncbi:MAG: KEOPS complex subunit Pcc1 [Thermoplasmatota archaeon]